MTEVEVDEEPSGGLYRVFYGGQWRAVTAMLRGPARVLHPEQATAVVIEVDGGHVALPVTPGDIFTEWMPPVPPPDAWEPVP